MKTKVLHLPSTFFPLSTGGKEVFVYQLIKNAPELEHRVLVHEKSNSRSYLYNGVRVDVLPAPSSSNRVKSYYDLLYDDLSGFEQYLDEYQPSVVHFHDQGENASLSHLRACKAKDIKTLLTYHSPGQSCLQRGLLFEGEKPCDGVIELTKCTYCRFKVRNIPTIVAKVCSKLELPLDAEGRLVLRNSTKLFKRSWNEFYNEVDIVQVHAHWVKDMLLLNGVDKLKIKFVELGGQQSLNVENRNEHEPLKLVFIGRCTNIKGAHLLIDAVKSLPPDFKIEVHFFGPYWDDTEYGIALLKKIKNDLRFKMPVLLPPDKVVSELSSMDVCVIPSLWPETGPFTVLDAFAAGIPIIGARNAGIQERVKNGIDGLLFNWGDGKDLADKIRSLFFDKNLLFNLKSNIRKNHSFKEMALEISSIYQILNSNFYAQGIA